MRRSLVLLLSSALILAACGRDGDETANEPDPTTTTETTLPLDESALPGERVEIYPYAGAQLAVVGVAADDTLKVRSGPGVDFDVVFELEPLATDVTATGDNRSLTEEGGFWSRITADDRTGWANTAFLSHLGQVTDTTSAIAPRPADRPSAETMLELGQMVADRGIGDAPSPRITVVDGPRVGDLAEITIDVLGLADDAQGGVRLHIFAEPHPDGELFTLRTVEATALCTRAVTDDGLCV